MALVNIEVKQHNWGRRYNQLKEAIKLHLYLPSKEAVQKASSTSSSYAPVFNRAEYTSDYWKWVFQMHPGYEPKSGALAQSIIFNESQDASIDTDRNTGGYWLGFGNLQRMRGHTSSWDEGLKGYIYLGGKQANKLELVRARDIRGTGAYSLPGGLTVHYSLADMGYWLIQEYGYVGKSHIVQPKIFMQKGYFDLTLFWASYMRGRALKMMANDWNNK